MRLGLKRVAPLLAACLVVFAGSDSARARIIEASERVSVKVKTDAGKTVAQDIGVTVFYDTATATPRPVLVLNHGRSGSPIDRAALRASSYASAARWFTSLGFIVAVPIRVGYGATGGNDVEDSGPCERKNYPPGFDAAMVQTLAVLDALRQRADVDKRKAVVVGQSYGGTTAITVAASKPAGVQATINFAGGGGGGPKTHPQNPCSQAALLRLFSDYGKTARMPTLWIYSENDRYFGPQLPRKWFDAFKASGGVGEFALFPAVGDDGHLLFSRAPQLWQPRVQEFLRPLGYQPLNPRTARK